MVTFETRFGYANAGAGMGKELIFLDKRNAIFARARVISTIQRR